MDTSAVHRTILGILLTCSLLLSCKNSSLGPGQGGSSSASSPGQRKRPSLRQGTHVLRSLLQESARAELWERGLLINMGTPDQHKYIRGRWHSGWGVVGTDEETVYLEAHRRAKLAFHDWFGGARELIIRARSHIASQRLTLYLDGRALATRHVPRQWTRLQFPLSAPLQAGRRSITLAFTGSSGKVAAQVDWLWLKTDGKNEPDPVKVAPLKLDSPRRALLAAPPKTLSFYLEVPRQSALVFDYGGSAGARFDVRVTVDGEPTRSLFSATSEQERWTEARVDLGELAGKLARLDLITRGKADRAGWGEPDLVRQGPRPKVPRVAKGKRGNQARNLIYVLIDTARQDAYRSFAPKTRVFAPAMEALAKESTIFVNAYANSNWTNPSVATVLGGVYPVTHQVKQHDSVVPAGLPLISEHLQKHGFSTAGFIANGYTSEKFGFRRGWNHYRNYIREGKPTAAKFVYADALAWVKDQVQVKKSEDRLFVYIQTIDPHVAYDVAKEYWGRYYEGTYRGVLGGRVDGYETTKMSKGKLAVTEDDRRWTHALYHGEITYHDEHFGRFIAQLRELGILDETLLIVSNDHGEEMFDHKRFGHGHSLYEELIRSPLLIRYPVLFPAGKQIAQVVELVDMVPTELQALGLPPMPSAEGVSLLGAAWGRPAMVQGYAISEYQHHRRAVRLGSYKLIQSKAMGGGGQRLFDVVNDRGERSEISASHPVARRACEVYLAEGLHLQRKDQRLKRMALPVALSAGKATFDPELRRQLQALGYLN